MRSPDENDVKIYVGEKHLRFLSNRQYFQVYERHNSSKLFDELSITNNCIISSSTATSGV